MLKAKSKLSAIFFIVSLGTTLMRCGVKLPPKASKDESGPFVVYDDKKTSDPTEPEDTKNSEKRRGK